jgi:hypothetical protein
VRYNTSRAAAVLVSRLQLPSSCCRYLVHVRGTAVPGTTVLYFWPRQNQRMVSAQRTCAGFRKFSKKKLALSPNRKQKYQNGNIHRKLTVSTSVILPRPRIQYVHILLEYYCHVPAGHHYFKSTIVMVYPVLCLVRVLPSYPPTTAVNVLLAR